MLADLRFAFRQLFKSPGYSAIAIATLALGIGLNTSMFSMMNALLLRPLPYADRAHLVRVFRTNAQSQNGNHSGPAFLDLRRETSGFLRPLAFRLWGYTLTQPGRSPENLNGVRVSTDFLSILGVQPLLGRSFSPDEDRPGSRVLLLGHATWLSRFGGDPAVVGRTVTIDGEATTIIGVLPADFANIFLWGPGDAFAPLGLTEAEKSAATDTSHQILARFDASITLEQLNARLATVATQLAPTRPREQSDDGLRAALLQSTVTPQGMGAGTVLLVCVAGVVLLIVCANLASLQLARAVSRNREFAIRAALGASRARLLRPLLAESLVLATCGGVLGLLVAVWGNAGMASAMAASLPVFFDFSLDWRVLTFAFLVSLGTGVVFGLAPAWLSSRVRMNDALKSGARGSTGDRSQHHVRNALIVLQFAAVLVQLSCTGFFVRGMRTLQERNLGWTPAGVTQCVINLPPVRYPTPVESLGFYTQLEDRLRALPGVEHVAIGWTAPLFQFLTTRNFVVDGREPPPPGREPTAFVNAVTPGYLDTLRIRLVAGRNLGATDTVSAPLVVLINESMARALFPEQDPVGQRLTTNIAGQPRTAEIVGVFGDVAMAGNPSPVTVPFQVFQPLAQESWNYVTVLVRSAQPMTEPLRRTVNELDPNIPVQLLNTMEELAKISTRGMEVITSVFVGFGALGLFLAAMGLYGVIARLVMQRTAEIGIRLALGAQLRDILSLIMGAGCRLALVGAGLGLVGSIGVNLLLGVFFNNGSASLDYPVLSLTTGALVVVAILASWLPARRATRISPIEALRAE